MAHPSACVCHGYLSAQHYRKAKASRYKQDAENAHFLHQSKESTIEMQYSHADNVWIMEAGSWGESGEGLGFQREKGEEEILSSPPTVEQRLCQPCQGRSYPEPPR